MNNGSEKLNSSGQKGIIIAICSVAAVVLIVVALLLSKNTAYYKMAKNKAENNQFKSAQSYLDGIENDKAKVLYDYATLRVDINSSYASQIAAIDINQIREWSNTAQSIAARGELLPTDMRSSADALSIKLNNICTLYDEYNSERYADISNLMDVFNEINYLYTKDAEGKNTTFTVAEENGKIQNWLNLYNIVNDYSSRLPNGDSIYLLTYLLKETQGEIDDLNKAIAVVTDSGYSETDTVRVSGDGHKNYPSITNSDGVSVNLARKDEYMQYLYSGICRALVESLAEYYLGI